MTYLHEPVFLGQVYIGASPLEGIIPEDGVPGVTKPLHTLTEIQQLIRRPILPVSPVQSAWSLPEKRWLQIHNYKHLIKDNGQKVTCLLRKLGYLMGTLWLFKQLQCMHKIKSNIIKCIYIFTTITKNTVHFLGSTY